jgi:hypothetical protein
MAGWVVRVGRGWRDQIPADVGKVLQIHEGHDKLGVLCVHADAHLPGFQGCSDIPFYGQSQDIDAAGLVFHVVGQFLAHLHRDEVDVASLIFVNFKPQTFSLSPRPEGVVADVPSPLEGLRWFCQNVVGSIRGEGMWSVCEWAMLSCTRIA